MRKEEGRRGWCRPLRADSHLLLHLGHRRLTRLLLLDLADGFLLRERLLRCGRARASLRLLLLLLRAAVIRGGLGAEALLLCLVLGADAIRLDKGWVAAALGAELREQRVRLVAVGGGAHGEGLGQVAGAKPLGDLRLGKRALHVAFEVAVEPLFGRLRQGQWLLGARVAAAPAALAAVVLVAVGRVAGGARILPPAVARALRAALLPLPPPAIAVLIAALALALAALLAVSALALAAATAALAVEAAAATATGAGGIAHDNRVQSQLRLVVRDWQQRERNEDLRRGSVRDVLELVCELSFLEAAILVNLKHLILIIREPGRLSDRRAGRTDIRGIGAFDERDHSELRLAPSSKSSLRDGVAG